jgi:acyl-CoA synthetase (AMP-forming)/AMP-acid ligase II
MIIDPIAHYAQRNPQAVAVLRRRAEVSFFEFNLHINALASCLQPSIPAGSRVAILVEDQYMHWLNILALFRLGHASISLDPAKHRLLNDLIKPDVIITEKFEPTMRGTVIQVSPAWMKDAIERGKTAGTPPTPDMRRMARITASSGTTGTPKMVSLTFAEVVDRMRAAQFSDPSSTRRRLLSMIGVDSLAGFTPVLRTWFSGGAVCLFPASPGSIIARGVTSILASPRQIEELVDALPPNFQPIPDLSISLGGGRVSRPLSNAIRLRLSATAFTSYGSTEAGHIAVCPLAATDSDPYFAGYIVPWCEVQAVDDAYRPLAEGQIGRLRIRSADVVNGYLDDPVTTAAHFHDGWFYPGDLGSVGNSGELYVIGRADEVINVGGVKVAPDLVEEVLRSVKGVQDVGVFTTEDGGAMQPWAAIVGTRVDPVLAQARLDEELASSTLKVRFLGVDSIPRNGMGKVQRFELRRMLASRGALGTASQSGSLVVGPT